MFVQRIIRWNRIRRQISRRAARYFHRCPSDLLRTRPEISYRAVTHVLRLPLDPLTNLAQHRRRLPARHSDTPDVTAIDVVLIRRNQQLAAILRQRNVLDLERPRSQLRRRPTFRRNRIQMHPARLLPRKRQPVAIGPINLIRRRPSRDARYPGLCRHAIPRAPRLSKHRRCESTTASTLRALGPAPPARVTLGVRMNAIRRPSTLHTGLAS